jgi:hypothetical protein
MSKGWTMDLAEVIIFVNMVFSLHNIEDAIIMQNDGLKTGIKLVLNIRIIKTAYYQFFLIYANKKGI